MAKIQGARGLSVVLVAAAALGGCGGDDKYVASPHYPAGYYGGGYRGDRYYGDRYYRDREDLRQDARERRDDVQRRDDVRRDMRQNPGDMQRGARPSYRGGGGGRRGR